MRLGREAAQAATHVLFPLTPALSLGEREPCRPALEETKRLEFADWQRVFSLSPRERAGVRGNGPCDYDQRAARVEGSV